MNYSFPEVPKTTLFSKSNDQVNQVYIWMSKILTWLNTTLTGLHTQEHHTSQELFNVNNFFYLRSSPLRSAGHKEITLTTHEDHKTFKPQNTPYTPYNDRGNLRYSKASMVLYKDLFQ